MTPVVVGELLVAMAATGLPSPLPSNRIVTVILTYRNRCACPFIAALGIVVPVEVIVLMMLRFAVGLGRE